MDTIGTLEDVVHHNFQDPECHESVFRPGHVANGSRELGHVTGPCQAVDGNTSLMTGNALLQFAAVTFGSCILFTHRCGGFMLVFKGFGRGCVYFWTVHTSKQYGGSCCLSCSQKHSFALWQCRIWFL